MGSVDMKSQEAVQAASGTCCGEWQSGGAAAAFDATLLEDREGVVIPVRRRWGCRWSSAFRGECGDCEAAEGAGRRAARMSAALQKVLNRVQGSGKL